MMILQDSINLFATNEKAMNFFGTWPESSKSLWTRKNKFHYILIFFVFIIPLVAFCVFKTHGSMFELSSCLSVLFAVLLGTAKFTILLIYQDNIVTIIDELNRFFKKTDRLDECKGLWKKVAAKNRLIVKVFVSTAVILIMFYSILPTPYRLYKTWKSGVYEDLRFPINLYDGPFVHNNLMAFSIMTIVNNIVAVYLVCFAIANDTLFIAFIYNTSIGFEYVGRRLAALKAQKGLDRESKDRELGDIIEDHAICIRIAEKVEKCLNVVMLFQYLGSLGNISFQMMQYAMIDQNKTQLISLLIFTIEDQIQMLSYYYFGDQLTARSQAIAYSVYDLEWYDEPVKFRKAVRRILEQSQQSQCITAGKFSSVSLETYGKFLNMAYTVFTFFRSAID